MKIKDKLDIIWASSHYLIEDLPLNFTNWSDKKLDQYLMDNAWQPFESMNPESLYENIENLAKSMRGYIKNEKKNK